MFVVIYISLQWDWVLSRYKSPNRGYWVMVEREQSIGVNTYPLLDMNWELVYMNIKYPTAKDLMDTYYPNAPDQSDTKLSRSLTNSLTI